MDSFDYGISLNCPSLLGLLLINGIKWVTLEHNAPPSHSQLCSGHATRVAWRRGSHSTQSLQQDTSGSGSSPSCQQSEESCVGWGLLGTWCSNSTPTIKNLGTVLSPELLKRSCYPPCMETINVLKSLGLANDTKITLSTRVCSISPLHWLFEIWVVLKLAGQPTGYIQHHPLTLCAPPPIPWQP